MSAPSETTLLALGLLLGHPFLHQGVLPSRLSTKLTSARLPGGTATGAVQFGRSRGGRLVEEEARSGVVVERTVHEWGEVPPETPLRELEALRARLEAAGEEHGTGRIRALDRELRVAREARATGQPCERLLRSEQLLTGAGGSHTRTETLYDYLGSRVIGARSSTRCDLDPGRVSTRLRTVEYDPEGRPIRVGEGEGGLRCEYDRSGRLLATAGSYAAPVGGFRCTNRSEYRWAKGGRLAAVTTESRPGDPALPEPEAGSEAPRRGLLSRLLGRAPVAEEQAHGTPPPPTELDTTRVDGLYEYD